MHDHHGAWTGVLCWCMFSHHHGQACMADDVRLLNRRCMADHSNSESMSG